MMMLWMLLAVFAAGGVGGVVNALMTDNGFALPRFEQATTGVNILRPGFVGNVIIGAVAALISWGLYGPLATYVVLGSDDALKTNSSAAIGLSLASLVGAALIGIGGARWLTNEVDKNLLRAAASNAAGKAASPAASEQIAMASPAQALSITRDMI